MNMFSTSWRPPAIYRILRCVTPIYKGRAANEFVSPPVPPAVFEGTSANVSLLAGMLVDKFSWHLPIYRQQARMKAAGIILSLNQTTPTN